MKPKMYHGDVSWTRNDLISHLEEFAGIYADRPIRDNVGGMCSPHLFPTWFLMKTLQPEVIVENGVFRGQGTYFMERACPNATLFCLDPNLERIEYRARKATYIKDDFVTQDWHDLPKDKTVVFFDDHQNAYERIKQCNWFGFRHMMFEDNYPASQGNCYSPKKAFMHAGFRMDRDHARTWKARLRLALINSLKINLFDNVRPNEIDAKYLLSRLEIYYEFPPVFKVASTRWGDAWTDEQYPTPDPLLIEVTSSPLQVYYDEAIYYTWIAYAKLR